MRAVDDPGSFQLMKNFAALRHASNYWGSALLAMLLVLLAGCSDSDGAAAADGGGGGSQQDPARGGVGGANAGATGLGGSSAGGSLSGAGSGGANTSGGQTVTPANDWLAQNSISLRVGLPLAGQNQVLGAQALATQLAGYDPGSLLRCELASQAALDAAIDKIGGVSWGYAVSRLEDLSKPRLLTGVERPFRGFPTLAVGNSAGAPAVEIAKADVVAVTEAAALFYSPAHGILLVDTTQATPAFRCAAQLPGRVNQFYYKSGQLVVMTLGQADGHSYLLHFKVTGSTLDFVEMVDVGRVNILDSRRFNDRLVFYTDMLAPSTTTSQPAGGSGGAAPPVTVGAARSKDRQLFVYRLGEKLEQEMHDTLVDSSLSQDRLITGLAQDTPVGTLVNSASWFGANLWASDRYFVATQEIADTRLSGWTTQTYNVCTKSHTVDSAYTYCWTKYETRPNPDYVPPDNSGGDRSCQGTTLTDCLRQVARVSNKTIQVPVGKQCEDRTRTDWFCDAYETRSATYPNLQTDYKTKLFIYEYTDSGFVQLDSKVHEIVTPALDTQSPDAHVTQLTTSSDAYDLAVPGEVQTLYFQNGYLYVISKGTLQVYTMGDNSLVRTATLPVVNDSLQSSLFSSDKLILSDYGWRNGDHSTLRVVDLKNPAFPSLLSNSFALPGGHRSIYLSNFGIFTVGAVATINNQAVNAIKLGLFADPYATEKAYSILATDLNNAWLGSAEAELFDAAEQRMLVPYFGVDENNHNLQRVGVSRGTADAIVSEGAVVVPEAATRVRALPGTSPSYMSFAANSIEWLIPSNNEWAKTPVLEYYQPTNVYRISDMDDYVEVDRLGERCELYFSNARTINQRESGVYSSHFDCRGSGAQAYGKHLLFADTAVEFDETAHAVRELSADEIAQDRTAIANRQICVLERKLVDDAHIIDYANIPPNAVFSCMSPDEYQKLQASLSNNP
jgi:hypothetical protein